MKLSDLKELLEDIEYLEANDKEFSIGIWLDGEYKEITSIVVDEKRD